MAGAHRRRARRYSRRMDTVSGMQLFVRVVETGSFSKASADLGVTQPTATRHVAALEAKLGARLLNRNTRGVSATEIGALYYEKCKSIQREIEAADSLATLLQSQVAGRLRISTSVAFGRRVLTPLVLQYMLEHPEVSIDLSFDDRYVNLVEQGVDLAIRMGRLADSSLGARYLGLNPWVLVGAHCYLERRGVPATPADLARHACLVYSSVQGDDRWHFGAASGTGSAVAVSGPLRSNNLTTLLAGVQAGMGIAILPRYVAQEAIARGEVRVLLDRHALPAQEMHAVFPSPKLVPGKVTSFIAHLQQRFDGEWWLR